MDRPDAAPPEPPEPPIPPDTALQAWVDLRQRLQQLHAELEFLRLMAKLRLGR